CRTKNRHSDVPGYVRYASHGRRNHPSRRFGGGVLGDPGRVYDRTDRSISVHSGSRGGDFGLHYGLAALAEGEGGAASGLARSTFARRRTACAALCAAWRDTPSRAAATPAETPSTRIA